MSAAARQTVAVAACEGRMKEKRFCSMDHPAALSGERAGRTSRERAMGVLWRHSSFNLVEPQSIALAAALASGGLPEIANR